MSTVEERFWSKVLVSAEDECWQWTAARNRRGYGWFSFERRAHLAHRVAYILSVGPIPDGLTIDHLCFNQGCVNPAHLEAVTIGENFRRAVRAGRMPYYTGLQHHNRKKSHCPHGHPYSDGNVYYGSNGARRCRACRAAYEERHRPEKLAYLRAYHARRRAEVAA